MALALIDDFRTETDVDDDGSNLLVYICLFGYIALAIFYPSVSAVNRRSELINRLFFGLPAFLLCVLPALSPVHHWLKEKWNPLKGPLCFLSITSVFIVLFQFFVGGGVHWQSVVLASLYLGLPFLVLFYLNRKSQLFAAWLGMAFYLFNLLKPPIKMVLIRPQASLSLDLNIWFLLSVSSLIFLYRYQLNLPIRYSWKINSKDIVYLVFGAVVLLVFVVLPARLIGFTDLVMRPRSLMALVVTFFAKTFLVALSEEFLFRGITFEAFPKRGKWWTGRRGTILVLLLSSLWFGLYHFRLAGWSYVFLATLAGLVYGGLYLKTESLAPPMLLHGLLDTVKFLFYG